MKNSTFICVLLGIISICASCLLIGQSESSQDQSDAKKKTVVKFEQGCSDPSLSPDGKKIAYKKPFNGVQNIWICTIGRDDDRMLTNERYDSVGSYSWSPDGHSLLYRLDHNGDERYRLYKIDINSEKVMDLTPFKDAHVKIIGMNKKHPQDVVVEIRRNGTEGDHNYCKPDAYRINIGTGSYTLVAKNPGNIDRWIADNDLKVRAAVSVKAEDAGITCAKLKQLLRTKTADELYDIFTTVRSTIKILTREHEDQEHWKEIRSFDGISQFNYALIGFTPDNRCLYMLDSKDSDTNSLIKIDAGNGSIKETLAHTKEYDLGILTSIVDSEPSVIRDHVSGKMLAVLANKQKPEWIFFDDSVESDFQHITDQLGEGFIELVSCNDADNKWIISWQSDIEKLRWYLFNRVDKELEPVFGECESDDSTEYFPMTPVRFTARDGISIDGYITVPVQKDKKLLPMVLLVHGGPLSRDCWGFDAQVQWLARQGYVVMQINYRGSTTYGKQFAASGNQWKAFGTTAFNDLVDGVQWAIKEKIADPAKIAIMGASQGGYEALCGATYGSHLFCCAVDICGPSNWELFIQPPQSDNEEMNGLLDELWSKIQPIFRSVSPVYAVDRVKRPLLLIYGRHDTRVSVENALQFTDALGRMSKKYQLTIFEDEGHMVNKSDNLAKMYDQIEQFLAKSFHG